MILAVNIGNTNIRVALGDLQAVFYSIYPMDEAFVIAQIEEGLGADVWGKVEDSIIATVVPAHTDIVKSAIRRKTGLEARRVDIQNCGTLNISHYQGLLGEDRVVCCAYALQKFTPPFIVIDYGTATTINVVNGTGEFMGGAILTGLQTGLEALTRNTAQLPSIDFKEDIPLIGRNTVENLRVGAVVGLACSTGGYIRRIEQAMACSLLVIVTGGHAPIILPHCDFDYKYEPSLLLDGLLALYG